MSDLPDISFPNLGIHIDHLSREAFSIFGVSIYWYALIIMTGFVTALLLARRKAKQIGQDPELYSDFFIWTIICGILGARAYYVIFSWDSYKSDPARILNFREGGLAIYGGIIAVFFAAVVFTRVKKVNFLAFCDVCAPCLAAAQAIGRWGNFVNREVFGGWSDGLLAMRYKAEQVSVIPPSVAARAFESGGVSYIQVQPTFLYESLWNAFVFAALTLLARKKRFDGQVLFLYFIGYGTGRFYIEGIRTDQLFLGNTELPVSQVVSAALIVLSVAGLIVVGKSSKKTY
ncbi:MAG: prolipoprotein diacylglyceryl transferase [Clostridiales bacterium]|nr:prolipoprotein diacylglyceryl transferase [Clostridiales bacterium]